jgi:hypothetical protein
MTLALRLSVAPCGYAKCASPKILKRGKPARAATAERKLALANAMREFDAGKGNGRRAKGLEGKHWRAATLDCSMVLLNDVVEIPATAYHDGPPRGFLLP